MEYKGIVMNYGVGAKMQYPKRMIIMVPGATPEEARGLAGSKVSWPYNNPTINGRIIGFHGRNNGHLLATFKKGLPGTAIGNAVKITKK